MSMEDAKSSVGRLYSSDAYISKNPTLHEEDSQWKVEKILPLVDTFCTLAGKKEIDVLDVGGGAGIVLRDVSAYIEKTHGIKVRKHALDMSPGMLKIQAKNNPGLSLALNEDITKTSMGTKCMDLILMIDVIEHIPDQKKALSEIARISRFAIFKVPLEDNLTAGAMNLATLGRQRRHWIETIGHCNTYTFGRMKKALEKNTGEIMMSSFTNVFQYYSSSEFYIRRRRIRDRVVNTLGRTLFSISPRLCSLVFSDFSMFLVKCR
jgi:SAM-dependent methyltransferase